MKTIIAILLTLLSLCVRGQRYYVLGGSVHKIPHVTNIPDGVPNLITPTGYIINDTIIMSVWSFRVDSVVHAHPGWRMPTIKELQEIFNTTYDKQRLRCAVNPSLYRSSDMEITDGDTLRLSGLMYGKEFQAQYPKFDWRGNQLPVDIILIKKKE